MRWLLAVLGLLMVLIIVAMSRISMRIVNNAIDAGRGREPTWPARPGATWPSCASRCSRWPNLRSRRPNQRLARLRRHRRAVQPDGRLAWAAPLRRLPLMLYAVYA